MNFSGESGDHISGDSGGQTGVTYSEHLGALISHALMATPGTKCRYSAVKYVHIVLDVHPIIALVVIITLLVVTVDI